MTGGDDPLFVARKTTREAMLRARSATRRKIKKRQRQRLIALKEYASAYAAWLEACAAEISEIMAPLEGAPQVKGGLRNGD